MKRMIDYGSTPRFEGVLKTIRKSVKRETEYKGVDEDGKPILEHRCDLPTYKAQGFEKIHGQNYAVCYSKPDGMWYQMRNSIVEASPTAKYLKEEPWLEIINDLADEYGIDLNTHIITVYGEHCGGNIQKLSAVSGLSKRFVIFADFKVSPLVPYTDGKLVDLEEGTQFRIKGEKGVTYRKGTMSDNGNMYFKDTELVDPPKIVEVLNPEPARWYPTKVNQVQKPTYEFGMPNYVNVSDELFDIYNIRDFPSVELDIDFNEPEKSINKMVEMVADVEDNSGVAKYFDKEGNIGEGYVFSFYDGEGTRHIFKAKGEKHSANAGKVKSLKPVDQVKEQKKRDFVNTHAMQSFRLNQAWEEVFGVNNEKNEPDIKFTGDLIKFMMTDTIKEEADILIELGLEDREVRGLIASQTKEWFLTRLQNLD